MKAAPSALFCGFGLPARPAWCALPLGARPASSTGLCWPHSRLRAGRRGSSCTSWVGTRSTGQDPSWPYLQSGSGGVLGGVLAGLSPSFSVILSPKRHTGKEASSEGGGVSLLPQWRLTLWYPASLLRGFSFISQVCGLCSLNWCASSR